MAQLIEHDRYPKFVADQVLTEKSLNQMFGYLEEQQRLTRTTLIGIGILCGLEVSVNADSTELTISEGVGVTSKGYLVPFPETTYTLYDDTFSAEKEIFYEPFLDISNSQKFPLYLLHNELAADVQIPLSADFLEDKFVVIFVELLRVDNINCDPDSCDDKGCTVEVTFRPLLVAQEDIGDLIFTDDSEAFLHEPTCIEWPEIKMPKYNVPSTPLPDAPVVLKGFLDVLTSEFIKGVETVLSAAYNSFGYYIEEEYPTNPFSGLENSFSFLFNGGISSDQLLHVQYYYDFFSDLILSYEELRRMCNDCLALCCPNQDLFPRHLILGRVVSSPEDFRHLWIPSPAFACNCCSGGRIVFLLKKIALLLEKIRIPREIPVTTGGRTAVQITPSNYGKVPLSKKAIPYYYDIPTGPNALYDCWNYRKSRLRKATTNLSYDSDVYAEDDYHRNPLDYDIEPFNFLRVEGHIGMNWEEALEQANKIKHEKRLPIDIIALNANTLTLKQNLLMEKVALLDSRNLTDQIALRSFAYFALRNPGIQHKAGVTTGGTFILVYNDQVDKRIIDERIHGVVTDANGTGIPGVTIRQKDSTIAAITDSDGKYTIHVVGENPKLMYTIDGFREREIDVFDSELSVRMNTNSEHESLIMEMNLDTEISELVDESVTINTAGSELTTLVNQFPAGTVIADFFVPYIQSISIGRPTDPVTDTSELPTINLRWGVEKRTFNSLVKHPTDNSITAGSKPEEISVDGNVHLMHVNLFGDNNEWLSQNPKLHLLRYRPKKGINTVSKSGFRKEAQVSLTYYERVNEFNVDSPNMTIDIKPDRYFSYKRSKKELRAMGLHSAYHNLYFYLVLSIQADGKTIFGKPSKIFKITINEENLLSYHIS